MAKQAQRSFFSNPFAFYQKWILGFVSLLVWIATPCWRKARDDDRRRAVSSRDDREQPTPKYKMRILVLRGFISIKLPKALIYS